MIDRFWMFVIAGIPLLALPSVVQRIERENRRKGLSGRQVRSPFDIYTDHYNDAGICLEQFKEAWRRIGTILHVEPGRLRPSDNLADLAGLPRWVFACLPVSCDLEEFEFLHINRRSHTPSQVVFITIDDLVRFLADGVKVE